MFVKKINSGLCTTPPGCLYIFFQNSIGNLEEFIGWGVRYKIFS